MSGSTDEPTTTPDSEASDAGEISGFLDVAADVEAADESASELPLAEVVAVIEAMLYAASEPLSPQQMSKHLPEANGQVKDALAELEKRYAEPDRGLSIVEVAGGYQIATRPEHHERISRLFKIKKPSRLSIQALETLSVVAYRQPVTVPEIMELRGVNSVGVIRTLLEKRLIKIVGRKNVVGRPLLYGTTKEFMFRFGLKSVKDLPQLQDMGELFGEEMAEQLAELDSVLPPAGNVDVLPLEDGEKESGVEAEEVEESEESGAEADDDDEEDDEEDE